MKIWDDIATLPAWAVTIGWLLLMFWPFATGDVETATFVDDYGYVTVGPLSWQALLFLPVPLWYFAVYQSAANRSRRTLARNAAFAGWAIGYAAFLVAGASLYERAADPPQALLIATNVSAVVLLFSWFGGIAVAAAALNEVDHKPEGGAYGNFGTFALMFYLPFGIWLLQPRIQRMITKPQRSEAVP